MLASTKWPNFSIPEAKGPPVRSGPPTHFWIKAAGLWWPLVVFAFEVITRGCAGTLFDPMPDPAHHLLVLTVPLAAWIFLRAAKPEASPRLRTVAPWLAGMALAVSLYYALRFLPFTLIAVAGVIFFGVGLLALGPLLAFTAMMRMRGQFRKFGSLRDRRCLSMGFWLMTAVLLLVEIPASVTAFAVKSLNDREQSPAPADWAAATRMMRRFGSDKALLRSCYGSRMGAEVDDGLAYAQSWLASLFLQGQSLSMFPRHGSVTVSRDLYYRVTGRSFDGQESSRGYRPWLFTTFNSERNFFLDEDRGGTRVAGKTPGLSLGEGRLDWHCEEASGLTWGEWTLTFENSGAAAQEARCRIALPPEGFVSRVTLWVNGEPQEAAYSTVAKVRNAYEQVAVRERRDPVLVTQPDAGSVLVQAFPVPARGRLKTRISFTAPAGLDSRVWLPSILESNFNIGPAASLPLWVQADHGTLELPAALKAHAVTEAGAPTATASLTAADITGLGRSFVWRHQTKPVVFCTDPFAAPEHKTVVRSTGAPASTAFKPQSVAWVIDTSAPMEPHRKAIEEAVKKGSPAGQSAVFLPDDSDAGVRSLTNGGFPPLDFAGGRDNTAALLAALEWLRGRPDAALIWLHGPQPLQQMRQEALDQLLQRGVTPVTVVDVPLIPGENRLSPHLSARERIRLISVRSGAEGTTLGDVVESSFSERGGKFITQPAESPLPEGAVRVQDSLARWHARLETSRLGFQDAAAASTLASSRQLVTPWSGAVVLERSEDYKRNGLEQADVSLSQQVPVIPEPSSALLLFLTAGHWLFRRRR
ncbi:MAG: PEP-CTERM sorting domain-containing protein [Verrucomicrobiaceae bacterium]|nr:MAG: PEP-CTERM sorting domain-containing protein [Verrucomicrobiaceae bacterium]